jgi:hypothetical protein
VPPSPPHARRVTNARIAHPHPKPTNQSRSILRTAFPALTEEQIDDLFARVDVKGYGAITYGTAFSFLSLLSLLAPSAPCHSHAGPGAQMSPPDEFVEFAGKNPEYVRLLLDVRKERQKQEKQQAQAASTPQSKKND